MNIKIVCFLILAFLAGAVIGISVLLQDYIREVRNCINYRKEIERLMKQNSQEKLENDSL